MSLDETVQIMKKLLLELERDLVKGALAIKPLRNALG
jgi:hypothetical protein